MKFHDVQMIEFDGPGMLLKVDGRAYKVDLPAISTRLANAKDEARRSYSISPSGYGIHWPELDEDLTIDGLIASATRRDVKEPIAPFVLREQPQEEHANLREHLRRVIDHIQATYDQFNCSSSGTKTMPIPFFGDIEEADILTVGVNPAASEFYKNRNWPDVEATPEYLEPRLRNYFRLTCPPPHRWFSAWEKVLETLNHHSYSYRSAHVDLSPRATFSIPAEEHLCKKFLEMVESDLPLFFESLLLCRSAKVMLLGGSITKHYYLNEFLRERAPKFGYELLGSFQRRTGGKMFSSHRLVSKTGSLNLPVFFFSCGPRHPETLRELVANVRSEICDQLNDL